MKQIKQITLTYIRYHSFILCANILYSAFKILLIIVVNDIMDIIYFPMDEIWHSW